MIICNLHVFTQKNHIRISGKTGIPVDVLGKGLTKHALKTLDDQYAVEHNVPTKSIMSGVTSIRSKTETSDERRDRKKLVKEYRRVSCLYTVIFFTKLDFIINQNKSEFLLYFGHYFF